MDEPSYRCGREHAREALLGVQTEDLEVTLGDADHLEVGTHMYLEQARGLRLGLLPEREIST